MYREKYGMNYLRSVSWFYYAYLLLVLSLFWLRPALVSLYDSLYGPAVGDPYIRVNGIYFPILWFIYGVHVVTFLLSLSQVIKSGGAKHWVLLVISGIFVAYFTFYLAILGGAPGGMLG